MIGSSVDVRLCTKSSKILVIFDKMEKTFNILQQNKLYFQQLWHNFDCASNAAFYLVRLKLINWNLAHTV